MKPVPGIPKPLTKEEKEQRAKMFLAQKKDQFFQGCLFSILSNPNVYAGRPEGIIEKANEMADLAIAKLYGLEQKEDKK